MITVTIAFFKKYFKKILFGFGFILGFLWWTLRSLIGKSEDEKKKEAELLVALLKEARNKGKLEEQKKQVDADLKKEESEILQKNPDTMKKELLLYPDKQDKDIQDLKKELLED